MTVPRNWKRILRDYCSKHGYTKRTGLTQDEIERNNQAESKRREDMLKAIEIHDKMEDEYSGDSLEGSIVFALTQSLFDSEDAEDAFDDGYCGGTIESHTGYEDEFNEGVAQAAKDDTDETLYDDIF